MRCRAGDRFPFTPPEKQSGVYPVSDLSLPFTSLERPTGIVRGEHTDWIRCNDRAS